MDDVGRVAAELEHQALEWGGCTDGRRGGGTAGERDPVDPGSATSARLASDAPGRTLIAEPGKPASSRTSATWSADSGAWWAGFDDDRVARGEGRGDLVHDEVERGVERRDGRDDAERLADDERRQALAAR